MTTLARDNHAYRYPVSIKGVVAQGNDIVLLRNSRQEWELPGGKLESHEAPEVCVAREIEEELSLSVRVGPLLDAWTYRIGPEVIVLIVTYGVDLTSDLGEMACSSEHQEARVFSIDQVDALRMPDGYKRSIRTWTRQRR